MNEISTIPERERRALTPMDMIEHAVTSGASMEIVEKLMALQERWDATQARKAFDSAMAEARAEIPPIAKNRAVDFTTAKGRTNYKYEDLAEIARTIDPILGKHGLSYRFRTTTKPSEPISVTCVVSHRLGHSEENTLSAGRDDTGNKNSVQSIGSTITYLQRYALKAALGLAAANDDDGRGGGKDDDQAPADKSKTQRRPAPPATNVLLPIANYDEETGELRGNGLDEFATEKPAAPVESPDTAAGSNLEHLETMAREAASRGKNVFNTFYNGRTRSEKTHLRGMKDELVKLYPAP